MTADPSAAGSPRESVQEMLARARAERLAWRRGHRVRSQMEAEARRAEVARLTNRAELSQSADAVVPDVDTPDQPATPQGAAWGIVFGAASAEVQRSPDPDDHIEAPATGDCTDASSASETLERSVPAEFNSEQTPVPAPEQPESGALESSAPDVGHVARPVMPFESSTSNAPGAQAPAAEAPESPLNPTTPEGVSQDQAMPNGSDPTRPQPLDFRGVA